MTDGEEHGDERTGAAASHGPDRGWPTFELRCIIEDRDEHPDRCVVYPRDADDVEVSSRWIAATDGSYLDLDSVR